MMATTTTATLAPVAQALNEKASALLAQATGLVGQSKIHAVARAGAYEDAARMVQAATAPAAGAMAALAADLRAFLGGVEAEERQARRLGRHEEEALARVAGNLQALLSRHGVL